MVGNGVAVDKQRAFSLYEASVAQGIKQGHFNLGKSLPDFISISFQLESNIIIIICVCVCVCVCFHLCAALMLLNGEGTAQNIEKGVEHLEAAAKTGLNLPRLPVLMTWR